MRQEILLVDDEPAVRFGFARYFARSGFGTAEAGTLAEARQALQAGRFDAVLLDLRLPDGSGLDWVPALREENPDIAIVVITGEGDIPTAVEAIRRGADNFLIKPVDIRELEVFLRKSLEVTALRRGQRALRHRQRLDPAPYFGTSPAMESVRAALQAVVPNDAPVLLQGETGTGKGILARWLHANGLRKDAPFLDINCSTIRGELLASELFGHARGAFTSANQAKEGLLDAADGGTLFLDEIGDMDLSVQAQFLKVIEEKTFRRLGETRTRRVDFRLICATNRDLAEDAARGRFRSDLLFRINVFPVTIPRLRERREDLPGLVEHVLRLAGSPNTVVPPSVMEQFTVYSWPGNIRELRNVLERAVLLARGEALAPEHFPGLVEGERTLPGAPALQNKTLKELEQEHLRALLQRSGGDHRTLAEALGVSRATLYRKLKQLKQDR